MAENRISFPFELRGINAPGGILEEHGHFRRDGKHLFYASYLPESKTDRGVVLISPFAEEKVRTLRIFVSLSRALARLGMAVLYFDYFGDGDSEGEFEDATFEDRIADINRAVSFLSEKHRIIKVGLLGLRWGATLSALVSHQLSPEFLILWEPIVNTDKYFFDHLRSNVASQMLLEGKVSKTREVLVDELEAGGIITVEGYNLSGRFFVEARKHGLTAKKFSYDGKTLIVQISRNIAKIRPELGRLKEAFVSSEIAAVTKEFEWEKTETWNPAPPQLFHVTFDFLFRHGSLKK